LTQHCPHSFICMDIISSPFHGLDTALSDLTSMLWMADHNVFDNLSLPSQFLHQYQTRVPSNLRPTTRK